ncbi:MAG: GNAT family N-acetyltransferase [Sphingomicrobium sp.]
MHRIRLAVRENRLSDPDQIDEQDYMPFVNAGSAWVAETEQGLVGFVALNAREASVWALFIDPEAEGLGMGRALHDRVLKWASEHRLERVSLTTTPGTRADRFYRRNGWQEVGHTDEDEVRLERLLERHSNSTMT